MEYRSGSIGRVFTVRFDDGDDFLGGLRELARKEEIKCGWFQVLGGLRQAGVVVGPKEPVMPPEPIWRDIDTAREVLGFGTIFWDDEGPRIHLHAALGEQGEGLIACVRKKTRVYLILEVFIVEVQGVEAGRPWFEAGGFNRLAFY
ncbi:MAG: DUF296 domain-containing protein [Desulfobacterales bacterium]|nr:DUF296 domain-containing protein [Desulfobacterales bacterium]